MPGRGRLKKCNTPFSLPFSDREMATNRPSVDGANQSIAVVPLVFQAFGSNTTLRRGGRINRIQPHEHRLLRRRLERVAKMTPPRRSPRP